MVENWKRLEFFKKITNEIGDFEYDNLETENGEEILVFSESYNPIGLHMVDTLENLIYKQTLIPLTQ